jgi:hypothetical protein
MIKIALRLAAAALFVAALPAQPPPTPTPTPVPTTTPTPTTPPPATPLPPSVYLIATGLGASGLYQLRNRFRRQR